MLRDPDNSKILAWFGILFFGLGYPVGIFQLLDRRPQIIINEIGIFDRTTHIDFINWEIIHNAYLINIHGQKFICIVVDSQFEPSKTKGKSAQKLAGISKSLGFQELNMSLGNVNINAERLTDFILAMRKTERPSREKLIKEAFSNMA